MENLQSERQHVWDLIRDEKIAMLTTQAGDQSLRARPMATVNRDFDGVLWFMTKDRAPKLAEAVGHPQVCVVYSNAKTGAFVSISGAAKVIQDKAKVRELWSETARIWFPQGPEEDDIRLISIDVETAEYWESPSKVSMIYNYAKARTTGRTPASGDLGENKTVEF